MSTKTIASLLWVSILAAGCAADVGTLEEGPEASGKGLGGKGDAAADVELIADGEFKWFVSGWVASNTFHTLTYAADPDEVGGYEGALVISPGGTVKPSQMEAFARTAAKAGYVAVVVSYNANVAALPIPAGNQQRAVTAALEIRNAVPDHVSALMGEDLPVYGFGHSLGAAALGAYGPFEEGAFDQIVLFGAGELLVAPDELDWQAGRDAPVHLLVGDNDTVVLRDPETEEVLGYREVPTDVEQLEALFETETVFLEGVNHFCILPEEAGTGFRSKRPLDRAAIGVVDGAIRALGQEDCVTRVVHAMDSAFAGAASF